MNIPNLLSLSRIVLIPLLISLLYPSLKPFDFWMIAVFVGRDMLITFMRSLAIRKGQVLKTSQFGKVKTAFQMVSIVIIIMIYFVRKRGIYVTDRSVPYWIMVGVTVLTALSGLPSLVTNWRLFSLKKPKGGGEPPA